MHQVVCDRCKKVIPLTEKRHEIEVNSPKMGGWRLTTKKDLCAACEAELQDWLSGG